MNCYDELIAIRTRYGYSEFDRAVKSLMKQRIQRGDRERRAPLPTSLRNKLYIRQEGKCARCHDGFHIRDLTDDHMVPIAKGGENKWKNRRLVCQKCNREKSDADMITDSKRTGETVLQQLPNNE